MDASTLRQDPSLASALSALTQSHERLAATISQLSPDQLTSPAYPAEWSIASTLSHLGSGSEIFLLLLEAGLRGDPAAGMAEFQQVWGRWNARSPEDQVAEVGRADAALLARVVAMDDVERDSWRLTFFGAERDLAGLLAKRLSEHLLHTWDVMVALDPAATLAPDGTEVVLDELQPLVARAGRPTDAPVLVSTDLPERRLLLTLDGDGWRLDSATGDREHDAALSLPAEAFVRLVYGRLDPDHTPAGVTTEGVELDLLRRTFPGC